MRVADGAVKRAILRSLNEIVARAMTAGAAGNCAYSLAYVQLSAIAEELPVRFEHDAVALHTELPLFLVPKPPDLESEQGQESAKRKRGRRFLPAKRPVKKGGTVTEEPVAAVTALAEGLKAGMRATIREQLRKRLLAFEDVATEGNSVAKQFTRVNEIERLDEKLDAEVEDNV
jgi:hypothetical protein